MIVEIGEEHHWKQKKDIKISMYACVCISMYMYIYVCICMYMYVYAYICMHMYVYVCACICAYLHVSACMCLYVYVCVCICMYMEVCVCVYRNFTNVARAICAILRTAHTPKNPPARYIRLREILRYFYMTTNCYKHMYNHVRLYDHGRPRAINVR